MIHTKIYPGLGRYFPSVSEFASAACMSRTRATDILKGRKVLTEDEKQAIARAILIQRNGLELFDLDQEFRVSGRD